MECTHQNKLKSNCRFDIEVLKRKICSTPNFSIDSKRFTVSFELMLQEALALSWEQSVKKKVSLVQAMPKCKAQRSNSTEGKSLPYA